MLPCALSKSIVRHLSARAAQHRCTRAMLCAAALGALACRAGGEHYPPATDVNPLSSDTSALEREASPAADEERRSAERVPAAYADLSDGQIWFVIDTLEASEVDRARAALPRLTRYDVRRIAEGMIAEHEPMRDRLLRLADDERIAPAPSEEATRLRRHNESLILELLQAGAQADGLYVGAQTIAHREALRLLSGVIAVVDSELLRDELTELRRSVEAQLDHAREIANSPE